MPQIIGGVPIRMRSIRVSIDKPNFTINPTNCSPFTVDSQGIGDQGTVTDFSSYFQAVNCGTLPFKPSMKIKQLGGKKVTQRSGDPGLQFDLRTRSGDANIKSVAVTLPKAFAIDQRHLGNICSKAQLASERCAGRQAIGTATTTTPLLDAPLSGPAYAVSGFGKLPHVVFILDGQVTIMPEAESSSVKAATLGPWCRSSRMRRSATSASSCSAARRAIWSTPGTSAPRRRRRRSNTPARTGKS